MGGNFKNISNVALINLMLALVALGKDILLAGYLGTSAQADAFLLASFIVDAFGNNLIASALGVAVIPVFAGLHQRGEQERFIQVTRSLVVYTVVISALLAFLMFTIRYGLFSWAGAGLSEPSQQLGIGLFSLLIPTLLAFPLINIGISIMQVHNRFKIPALAPVLYNLVLLIGLVYLHYSNLPLARGVYALAGLIMIGLLVMLGLVWFPIFKNRFVALTGGNSISNTLVLVEEKPKPKEKSKPKEKPKSNGATKQRFLSLSSDLVSVWQSFWPYLITLLFPQMIYLVERYLASHLETGSISGLNYAFRLVQFPLWVFIAAISSVLFPVMAKLSALGDKSGFNKVLLNSINIVAVFSIPFSIILFVLRVPIITILLQRGEFSLHSVDITANIMAGYALTIIWQGFSVIWVRASLVEGKVFYALLAAAASAATTISLDVILVPKVGAVGLGYGAAIGAIINFATLYLLFTRFNHWQHSQLWRGLFRIVLANVPLLLVTVLFAQLWVRIAGIGTISPRFGYVVVVIMVCLPVYWLSLRLFRVKLYEKEM